MRLSIRRSRSRLPNLSLREDMISIFQYYLARYLESPESLVRQYAAYALKYFDSGVLQRVVPGRQPLRGGVR